MAVERAPTIASEVTPATELDDLNLDWRERQLPERERTKHVHRLHPYLGKFIPQLVEVFLRKYFKAGQTVLEPFAGSGTTLVQANELGINSVGFDVSAFNVMLCRAKLTKYDTRRVRHEIVDVLEKVRAKAASCEQGDLWTSNGASRTAAHDEYLNQWFAPAALFELLTYRDEIDKGGYEYRDLLRVILSRAARSARLTTHFHLDFPRRPQRESYWCYKHTRECTPTTSAFKFLDRYSVDAASRVERFNALRTDATWEISHDDARDAPIPQVDGLITSPPYVGLINYHEQHAYAYHLLGLEDRRHREIGAASAGSGKKAESAYKADIAEVFRKALSGIRSGGRLIVIAADKANLYCDIAAMAGVVEEATVMRHVNRRTGRRSGEFYESVFIWRKS